MRDDELAALIRSTGSPAARRGWTCPGEERLVDYVEGRIDSPLRERLERHVSECDSCRGQVGFLARVDELGPPPPVPASLVAGASGERVFPTGWLRPAWVTLAAGVALALALAVSVPRLREEASPGGSTVPVERLVRNGAGGADSPWLVRPAEGELVARESLALAWRGVPEALFYTVEIVDPNGDVAWEGRSESTRLAVPAGAPLVPGRSYYVWVLAHLRRGATVRSTAVGFRLAPG